jgi:hypothetical protein
MRSTRPRWRSNKITRLNASPNEGSSTSSARSFESRMRLRNSSSMTRNVSDVMIGSLTTVVRASHVCRGLGFHERWWRLSAAPASALPLHLIRLLAERGSNLLRQVLDCPLTARRRRGLLDVPARGRTLPFTRPFRHEALWEHKSCPRFRRAAGRRSWALRRVVVLASCQARLARVPCGTALRSHGPPSPNVETPPVHAP